MADRIAIMKGGRIQQLANPQTIYRKPTNLFVGGFIGSPAMNCLQGSIAKSRFELAGTSLELSGYDGAVPESCAQAIIGIRPEHFIISDTAIPDKTIAATVDIDEPMGNDSLLWLNITDGQQIAVRIDAAKSYDRGAQIQLTFEPAKCSLFDLDDEQRF